MLYKKLSLAVAATAASALALAGCGSVDSADSTDASSADNTGAESTAEAWEAPEGLSGELDYYSANPQGLTDALVEAFEEKTDVKVNVFADTTMEELVADAPGETIADKLENRYVELTKDALRYVAGGASNAAH